MSRPLHEERGARIAAWQADEMLRAHYSPDLFPQRLSAPKLRLWKSIQQAARDQLEECQAMREALRG